MRQPSTRELRAFTGLSMASAAISIDMILPAFSRIREDFGLPSDSAQTAGLISIFFIGFAVGPIPFGLLADRLGRRRTLLIAVALFATGACAAMVLPTLGGIMAARLLWGIGAAGIRTAVTASVRDRFVGEAMAREMAFAMAIFITVPIIAPLLGQALMTVLPWRAIFAVCLLFGVSIGVWSMTMPETLAASDRQPMDVRQVGVASRVILRNRTSWLYCLGTVALFASFASYLASFERIMENVFNHKSWFPYVFGATAVAMGLASLTVGRHVGRIGLARLINVVGSAYCAATVLLFVVSRSAGGRPNVWLYLVVLTLVLVTHNVLFPNLVAAAMIPVGHVAGTANAVMTTAANLVGAVVGIFIDRAYNGTTNPFSMSFAISGVALLLIVRVVNRPGQQATLGGDAIREGVSA